MSILLEMLRQEFMVNILVGVILVALPCALLGVLVVLRREVFVGAALAQVASLGGVIGLCLAAGHEMCAHGHSVGEILPRATALGAAVIAAVGLSSQRGERRLSREASIGILYAGTAALAILVVATRATLHREVLSLLFGNVLTMTISRDELIILGVVALLVLLSVVLLGRRFLLVSLDPAMAAGAGISVRGWQSLLLGLVGGVVAFSILEAGALVVFALLVIPASGALLVARSMRMAYLLAAILGVGSALVGVTISYLADWPTGPAVIVTSLVPLLVLVIWRQLRA
ncbi:MAG: iron chelate uptake ABC transporter family permease subunit [Anaerolineae bacterium]|nr:iron chelate uptake ABC transporter family permease subunit [Anaerolineae bacterium]